MDNGEGSLGIASSVVARIEVRDVLWFDVSVQFDEPIGEGACMWLNPGLSLIVADVPLKQLGRFKDPATGMELNRFEIGRPVRGFRITYRGLLRPLLMEVWGSRGDVHIARGEVFWYPFSASCGDLLLLVLLGGHREGIMRFRLRDGLSVAASLEYQGVEDSEHVYSGKAAIPLEFIAAPFRVGAYEGEKLIRLYSLEEPPHGPRQIHDAIMEVEGVYEDLFGVGLPKRQFNVVFLRGGGNFMADSLLYLDADYTATPKGLRGSLAHELAHVWWGGLIKPCSPDSFWLIEAVPEYIATVVLGKLGVINLGEVVEKLVRRAREVAAGEGYKPPTAIKLPLSEPESESWRVVGEAIFHEAARVVGYDELNRLLGAHMSRSAASTSRYCIRWADLLGELAALDEKVARVVRIHLP